MEKPHYSKKPLQGQRGAVAILFVLCLPVLLGFAALAIDLARLHLVKVELQNAADAAALGGARSLTDPVTSGDLYNWTAAEQKAQELAHENIANGMQIDWADIDTGYWNLQNPDLGLRSPGTIGVPGTGDVAAVQATISLSSTRNNRPLLFFFAPILGIDNSDLQATATAMIAPPAGGTGLFPMAISNCMFNLFWDTATNSPKLDPETGLPYTLDFSSVYSNEGVIDPWSIVTDKKIKPKDEETESPATSENCLSGQWTSFTTDKNDVTTVRNLIEFGNDTSLEIGESIWIQPGVEATIYDVKDNKKNTPLADLIGTNVAVPVVTNLITHSEQPIVAIAGFHIDAVDKHGNKSYITGHFINPTIIPGLKPGTGNGISYGAYTPPILVK